MVVEEPVVVVRLPVPRPKGSRPWTTEEEEVLLQRELRPPEGQDLDWSSVAQQLGREAHECITRRTYLHLQQLKRQQAQEADHKDQGRPHDEQAGGDRGGGGGGMPSLPKAGDGLPRQGPTLETLSQTGLAVSDLMALAEAHRFDWTKIGQILKADPWDCWKVYEMQCQREGRGGGEEIRRGGLEGAVSPPPRGGELSPRGSGLRLEPSNSSGALFHSVDDGGDDGLVDSTLANDDIPAFLPSREAGQPTPSWYLHQFPRHHQRPRPTPPLTSLRLGASHLVPGTDSVAHLQESTTGVFGGLHGTILSGQDNLSLSALESALLDMPSLYLGQSMASNLGSMMASQGGVGLFPSHRVIPDTIHEQERAETGGSMTRSPSS